MYGAGVSKSRWNPRSTSSTPGAAATGRRPGPGRPDRRFRCPAARLPRAKRGSGSQRPRCRSYRLGISVGRPGAGGSSGHWSGGGRNVRSWRWAAMTTYSPSSGYPRAACSGLSGLQAPGAGTGARPSRVSRAGARFRPGRPSKQMTSRPSARRALFFQPGWPALPARLAGASLPARLADASLRCFGTHSTRTLPGFRDFVPAGMFSIAQKCPGTKQVCPGANIMLNCSERRPRPGPRLLRT